MCSRFRRSCLKQTDLLLAVCASGRPVNIKKGQFLSPAAARGVRRLNRVRPQFIAPLARAAVAVGVAGVFMEVHEDPPRALSDGSNSLRLDRLPDLLAELKAVDTLVKGFR